MNSNFWKMSPLEGHLQAVSLTPIEAKLPNGLPKASEMWEGDVSFFSIDTNLIQSAGYDFAAGLLHQLPAKLPAAMQLQLSEVVVQEVVNHKMEPILAAVAHLDSASREIERISSLNMSTVVGEVNRLDISIEAKKHFRKIVHDYTKRCRGNILPIDGENLASEIFERYFKSMPPFVEGKKKAEFPDAAILITLERYAKERQTKGIIASADKGVQSFANASEHLYCVKSLEDLTALFVATDDHAMRIKARIDAALLDETSFLRGLIDTEIENHIADSEWTVGDIYSGSVSRVEGEAYEYELDDYEVHITEAEIWQSEDEPGVWIVDLNVSAQVDVSIDVTFYAWDSIDREEVRIGNDSSHVVKEISFKTYLNCGSMTEENSPEEWDILMDTARGNYSIDVGEVDPDFSDDSYEYD